MGYVERKKVSFGRRGTAIMWRPIIKKYLPETLIFLDLLPALPVMVVNGEKRYVLVKPLKLDFHI